MLCLEEEKEGMTGAYLAQVRIEMGALASAIFKIRLFNTRNGKILLTLSGTQH